MENNNLASTIYNTLGINIVTCGNCSSVNLHKAGLEEITCEYCNNTSDICDFPDLFEVTLDPPEYNLPLSELIANESNSTDNDSIWTSPKFSYIRKELKNLVDEGDNIEYTRGALEIISCFIKPTKPICLAEIAIELAKDLKISQKNIDKLY